MKFCHLVFVIIGKKVRQPKDKFLSNNHLYLTYPSFRAEIVTEL